MIVTQAPLTAGSRGAEVAGEGLAVAAENGASVAVAAVPLAPRLQVQRAPQQQSPSQSRQQSPPPRQQSPPQRQQSPPLRPRQPVQPLVPSHQPGATRTVIVMKR